MAIQCAVFFERSGKAAFRTIEGLRRLEYRGYDSSGIAVILDNTDSNSKVQTERAVGYVSDLESKIVINSRIAILLLATQDGQPMAG